jgi:HK97 family phage prohead protease
MPRPQADVQRRTLTLDTQRRSLDIPVDGAGHVRRALTLDEQPRASRASGTGDASESIAFSGKFVPFAQRNWIGSKRWGFTKTIREKRGENNDITFNRDHDNRLLLARTSNGTLRPRVDDNYGYADADMGAYSYARDVELALERRDLTGMSFAFDLITWEWSIADDGNDLLTHREAELFDIAVVGMPANVDTDASLRMDLLQVARSAGFDAASFDFLARRLADPDPDLIAALRALSRGDQPSAPVRSTQEIADVLAEVIDSGEARSDAPPAQTTGTPNPLTLRTLLQRTEMQRSI